MQIVIPMAGAGSRFISEGYTTPKPLIEVSGKPMVVQAVKSLPHADKYIFILRKEQEKEIVPVLQKEFHPIECIAIDYLTEGQAATCLLASSLLNMREPVIIGACDNGMVYDTKKLHDLIQNPSIDAAIFTFRNQPTVKRNPQMYGWVRTVGNRATEIKCKSPLSDTPIHDHAIVGAFYFRTAHLMVNAIERMMKKNIRINNEFYLDVAMNEMIAQNNTVVVFEIEKYICWGTPNDLKIYEYWEKYFTTQHE